jgi:basic membrane protein A
MTTPSRRLVVAALASASLGGLASLAPGRSAALALPRCAPSCRYPSFRLGIVFDVGGRGDKSFNDAAYAGAQRAHHELGVGVELIEPQGAEDRESAMRLFGARGFDLVVGVGFIFSSDVHVVAPSFPKTRFACIDYAPTGQPLPPNVVGLTFREQEGSFLVGAAAALVSKTGHVGFVGGMDVPLIHKFEAGFSAGARAARGDVAVHAAYAGATPDAFRDPVKGKALALSQIALGADVLFHASGTTGHGVFEAARDMRVFAIGVDADQHDEMPGTVLTSMVKRADVAVHEATLGVAEGRFVSGVRSFGLAEGGVDWVHQGPHAALLPADVVTRVEALRARVVSGALVVPEG